MKELSSYAFSPLRDGDIALYRGSGDGLAPILLVAAEETSLGSVERLEHEHACFAQRRSNPLVALKRSTRIVDRLETARS